MQFEKNYTIGAREIGVNNQITNLGILALLEDIAGMHSDTVGYGVKDIDTKKKAWILMDWKLKVLKRPKYAENVKLKTWARDISKTQFYTYRDFEMYNENGEKVAIASSKWVLMDLEKGKITKIEMDLINLYFPEMVRVFNEIEIKKIKIPDTFSRIVDYEVKRFDIDVNNHVHNLNYLNLAYEALPDEIYNSPEMNNIRITYKHQIKLGDKVKCCYSHEDDNHTVVIKSEDETIIHAIIELN